MLFKNRNWWDGLDASELPLENHASTCYMYHISNYNQFENTLVSYSELVFSFFINLNEIMLVHICRGIVPSLTKHVNIIVINQLGFCIIGWSVLSYTNITRLNPWCFKNLHTKTWNEMIIVYLSLD